MIIEILCSPQWLYLTSSSTWLLLLFAFGLVYFPAGVQQL